MPAALATILETCPLVAFAPGSEVWTVARRYAWLRCVGPAWISTHVPTHCKPVDELVERMARRHVLKDLRTWILSEASSVRDHLGYLPTCDRHERSEVACVVRIARFSRSTTSVAVGYLAAGYTPDEGIELAAWRYVHVLDRAGCWAYRSRRGWHYRSRWRCGRRLGCSCRGWWLYSSGRAWTT